MARPADVWIPIVVLLAVASTTAPARAGGPPLRLDGDALRLGVLVRGAVADGSVGVFNDGDREARYVGRLDADARLDVSVTPAVIAPHARAAVAVSVRTLDAPDSLDATALLSFACGGETTALRIPVAAEVETVFAIAPARLDFGWQVAGGPPVEARLEIAPRAREEVEVAGIDAPPGIALEPLAPRLVEGRRAAVYRVRFTPPARVGRFDGEVRFRFASARVPALGVAVRASLRSDVTATPAAVDLGRLVRGRDAAGTRVALASESPVAVLAVTSTSAALEASLVESPAPGVNPAILIRPARGAAAPAAGPLGAEVRIFIDRPELPVIVIPVRGEVVEPARADPPGVFLSRARLAAPPLGAAVEVVPEPGLSLEDVTAETGLAWLGATVERSGRGARVVLELRGAAPPGEVRSTLRIRARAPEPVVLDVPVFCGP